ncbi:aldehyde dehydrogenase [Marinoscillum furvescens]|uniref:Aminomuconate-semialdehyde/2-hydroxymuconate-6-semialdehyde dehydrogenase n=1 Tax=Marinoscillum furvescens DSM 4134 TaxID=1122208 RepID=A0A3D9KXG0_MARFU|nr:aldehyde dehydrogenase [Marinoscillum furvescens]RED93627.1 aminomuconate-semialdehyde/2-hydroxymuconate-6-semialdehyde dehydrogenase [Marinoscillum furvescens DSM 4134]
MKTFDNFIGGEFLPPSQDEYLPVVDPATGDTYAQVANATSEDLETALAKAETAFADWSGHSIEERSRVLMKLADLIEENLTALAEAESLDTGKPLSLASTVDIPRAAANFRFFASAIVNDASQMHANERTLNYTLHKPLGVVGCISPWNLPLYLLSWKIAPALATGNCVIAKPSEVTPYTAWMLGDLANQAGLPAGVLNILHGAGAEIGERLVTHPKIKAISFTGGTHTGRRIGRLAGEQLKKVSLELGGKNPVLVFADCDLEQAVRTSMRSAFTNQGEICLCGSRIFVESGIYEEFKQEFLQKVAHLEVGLPSADVDLGALVSRAHLEKVSAYVSRAVGQGATVLAGGMPLQIGNGFFYAPTVLEGLDAGCEINQQEVFGPVVTLIPFDAEEEAIQMANGTNYGLAAVVWTENLKRAHRVAARMESGIVWVNCWMERDLRTPFGGVKLSGVGREGGVEALRFFTEAQNICIRR